MEETIFFNFNGIIVSNSRFVVRTQTYAMQSVTSVKPGIVEPKRLIATVFVCIGILLFIGEFLHLQETGVLLIAGILAVLIGAVAWYVERTRYSVILNTSAGEHHALISDKKQDIEHVLQALNQAIVSRG